MMLDLLRRLLPGRVKSAFKAIRVTPIPPRWMVNEYRLQREAQIAARSRKRRATSRSLGDAAKENAAQKTAGVTAAREQRDRARNRVEVLRDQRDRARALHQDAKRQRDMAREELRTARQRLAELQRRAQSPEDDFWEQRMTLAGSRDASVLRDFAYFPGGTQNPYLRLLYSRCPEYGFDPRPLARVDQLLRMPSNSIFHLHWTRIAQLGSRSAEEARSKTAGFLEPIEDFVGRGGTLLWSIHEPLPHDCTYPEVEIDLRNRLVDMAAGVHVLHKATIEEVKPHFDLDPAKVFVVEHPLYLGIYERYMTRASARRMLGLGEHEVLLLAFGAIRPYKGFDRIVTLLPQLRRETGLDVRVIVAGPTMASVDNTRLARIVEKTEWASMTDQPVPDAQVQVVFDAADVVVLPYREVLNSGVLMLGLTFAKPTVAPENAVTRDTLDSGLVHLFERSSDKDLYRAVCEAIDRRHDSGDLPAEFVARYDAESIAGEFARHLHQIASE